jgi:cholesterol transport system auxiliary component
MTRPLLPPPTRRMLVGTVTLAFAGCSRLFVSPPPKYIFRLTPGSVFPPGLPHLSAQLLVQPPAVPAALDRRRIALTKPPLLLDYFADAEWAETVSALVAAVLTNTFENSRAITVLDGSLGLPADLLLGTEVRHFEAQYAAGGGAPAAWVSIEAKLVAMPQRKLIAQALFERRVPAAGADLPSIAAAFDAALRQVATEIVVWSVTNAAMRSTRRRL